MMAMENLTCHWDGYAMNRNNYRIFHDADTDRMVFMPHGMDQMFGVRRIQPNMPILPMMKGPVARAVIWETPEGQRLYLERLARLSTDLLDGARLSDRVHEIARAINRAIAAHDAGLGRFSASHTEACAANILQRVA